MSDYVTDDDSDDDVNLMMPIINLFKSLHSLALIYVKEIIIILCS